MNSSCWQLFDYLALKRRIVSHKLFKKTKNNSQMWNGLNSPETWKAMLHLQTKNNRSITYANIDLTHLLINVLERHRTFLVSFAQSFNSFAMWVFVCNKLFVRVFLLDFVYIRTWRSAVDAKKVLKNCNKPQHIVCTEMDEWRSDFTFALAKRINTKSGSQFFVAFVIAGLASIFR